jgi:hypothetical protein
MTRPLSPKDQTLSGLDALASPASTDIIYLVSDPGGTPLSKKVTLAALTSVTDHGGLVGLADDDHTQYHTDARGDARYYTETEMGAVATPSGASLVGVEDSDAHYTGADVEAVLAEINANAITHAGAADPHPGYVLNSELTAHEGAADPHAGYVLNAELTTHEGAADPHTVYHIVTDLSSTSNALGASLIGIEDAGALYAATDVEAALAEVMAAAGGGTFLPLAGGTMSGEINFGDQWQRGGSLSLFMNTTGQYIYGDYSVKTIMYLRSGTSGKYGRFTAEATNIKYDCVGVNYDLALQTAEGAILMFPDGAETARFMAEGMGFSQVSPDCQIEITANPAATPDMTKGIALTNDATATAGNQKISPMLRFKGIGWRTDATAAAMTVEQRMYLLPVQGAAVPGMDMIFEADVNGAGWTRYMATSNFGGGAMTVDTTAAGVGIESGIAKMGLWAGGATFAAFGHKTVFGTAADYGFIQGPDGDTYVNAATGEVILFQINNSDIAAISSVGMHFNDNFKNFYGSAGDAAIYYNGVHLQFDTQLVGSGDAHFTDGVDATGGFSVAGFAGINKSSFSFTDAAAFVHTIIINGGLITQWNIV